MDANAVSLREFLAYEAGLAEGASAGGCAYDRDCLLRGSHDGPCVPRHASQPDARNEGVAVNVANYRPEGFVGGVLMQIGVPSVSHCPACMMGGVSTTHIQGTLEHPSPAVGEKAGDLPSYMRTLMDWTLLDIKERPIVAEYIHGLLLQAIRERNEAREQRDIQYEKNVSLIHDKAELEAQLDGAGVVLGRICVLGTLEHGETPVHDEIATHSSVRAIIHQITRAEAAESQLSTLRAELVAAYQELGYTHKAAVLSQQGKMRGGA